MNASITTSIDVPTVGQVLRRAQDYLARHGVSEPSASATRLLTHVLGIDRIGPATLGGALRPDQAKAFGAALSRRCSGVPVQHITGDVGFGRLILSIRPGVFVPRPETEVLVETLLAGLREVEAPRVVDIGTGTGAIALSVKRERPDARVVAIDVSSDAVTLARENASALALDVEVLQGDLLGALPPHRSIDAIVCNPPYVPAHRYPQLPAEVKADPYGAVVGDIGLYETLATQAADRLVPGGLLVVEIDDTQADAVREVLAAAGFEDVELTRDLAGRDRVVSARRSA